MTLKALLLGSAAAMIAVSGAQAADAVVAEPEAVDYVKVCDMYGAGFFYIPGTETCLKLSGYARVDYTHDGTTRPDSTSSWGYRARVNFDARNETDYGTLRSQVRFQGDGDGGSDGNVGVDRALISLGGLRTGYSDNFWTTNGGYGLPIAIQDGYYGYDQSIFLDYTFAANGFSFTAGIEDLRGGNGGASNPNFYGGGSYSGSWGEIAATVAYDNNVDDTAWVVKATFNVFDGFTLKGFYAGDGGDNTTYVEGTGEWAYGVGVSYAATSALDLYASYNDIDSSADEWYIAVGANYDIATGLRIQGEVDIYDNDQKYRVRLQRDF